MLIEQTVLRLILAWNGQCIVAAEVASRRPMAARVLVGQAAERAVDLVPRLFSLCGQAQGVAARLAWQAARGEATDAAALAADARRVALEAIGEHLWRVLLDWPVMLGLPARKEDFLVWRKRLLAVPDQAAAAVLGASLDQWLDSEVLCRIDHAPAATSGVLLPWLAAGEWAQQLMADDFAEQPSFAGLPAETGPLARRATDIGVAALQAAGQGVAARLAARYADLRYLAAALIEPQRLDGWLGAAQVAENVGLARVETARGLLLHLIQVNDDRVGRYVIVAPTEWNFHPQGAFVREMAGYPAASLTEAESAACRLALALDPCVAYEVEVKRVANDA
jgi:hypothetical protein